jgi:hypothetical protein
MRPTQAAGTAGLAAATFAPGIVLALALAMAAPLRAGTAADAAIQEAWRETMARTSAPGEGCFRTDYPSTIWKGVACVAAPNRPHLHPGRLSPLTVGDGSDYAAVVSGLISTTVGSFPAVMGVTGETSQGASNSYSLQINSQFFSSPTCAKAARPSQCTGWEQFVYDSEGPSAYMQYWLINYGASCPSTWMSDHQGSCYRNSNAVSVPHEAITNLKTLRMSGAAVAKGIDTLVLTVGTKAYGVTGKDSVVYLADAWKTSEWNIFGDGDGSEADFNKGASVTVKIALTDGKTTAPTCKGGDGTTAETNNLTLGKCVAAGGTTPSVTFTESLAK